MVSYTYIENGYKFLRKEKDSNFDNHSRQYTTQIQLRYITKSDEC